MHTSYGINDKGSCTKLRERGFALIASLSIMSMLVLIAVALFSLSSVATKSASIAAAKTKAQANAKMALMIAIGELQKEAGPDTRITAAADLLDADNPPLVGVWRSWEGSDHEANGRPVVPNYPSKRQRSSEGGRFVGWLVSSSPSESDVEDAGDLVFSTSEPDTIALLSDGSLGSSDPRQVHIEPSPIGSDGSVAWWISGENQKAHITNPLNTTDDVNESAQRRQSHGVTDPEPFGLNAILQTPTLGEKTISLETASLIESEEGKASHSFHDLSILSKGLLTNTATGGWRKDLSLLMASWDQQPSDGLPLFRITPNGGNSNVDRASPGNSTPDQGALYPWSAYRSFNGSVFSQQAAVSSWSHLANWMNLYQSMTVDAEYGHLSLPVSPSSDIRVQANSFDNLHRQRIYPLIARIQWVFYHYSSTDQIPGGNFPPSTDPPAGNYRLHLRVAPVVTFWNPYNFGISVDNRIYFRVSGPIPLAIRYSFENLQNGSGTVVDPFPYYQNSRFSGVMDPGDSAARSETGFNYDLGFERSSNPYTQMVFEIRPPVELGPGESMVFSPSASISDNMRGPNVVISELTPGVRDQACYGMAARKDGQDFWGDWRRQGLPGTTRIGTTVRFDNTLKEEGEIGTGVHIDVLAGGNLSRVWQVDDLDEIRYQMRGVYDRAIAAEVLPPILDEDEMQSVTVAEIHDNPTPFLSMIFGLRTANNGLLATKGLVQSSPFANSSRMGLDDFVGSSHPINSSYDFSYAVHPPGGDSQLPEISNDGSGFIVSGINSSNGLSRSVIAEIPTRPLASLVELTNWDLRFENPYPPYAYNLIGNSDASPLIPSNAVYNNGGNATGNLQHDDSYCANHLLFDDWFVSAIAPTTTSSPGGTRSQEQVFKEHLSETRPLPTTSYRPIVTDRASSPDSADAQALFDDEVAPVDSWKTIASRIEVEGMFNVNSTSTQAWRALLGHARGQKIPYLDASGQPTLSSETDYAYSRFAVSSDAQAGTNTGLSGAFFEASEFTGYRVFDDDKLDLLAVEIVEQVRQRGPFLSLSEFVNRQLSGDSLALAGAIQTALNNLRQSEDNNPLSVLEALSAPTVANPTGSDEGYQYPAAAEGFSTYGLPGWTRQADILRPLAPILSVRDDTFTIRAYGDALDKSGDVVARAYCEAVVQRTRDYVDPEDVADRFDAPQSPINRTFGRKFNIVSFKWLSNSEI